MLDRDMLLWTRFLGVAARHADATADQLQSAHFQPIIFCSEQTSKLKGMVY